MMGLLDWFRAPPPIRDNAAFATFIDERAAFLAQKGIYEYSRARAGHYSKVLFSEKGFRDAVEIARWRAYPLGLAMVGEVAEGLLRPHMGDGRRAALDPVNARIMAVYDGYPVPAALGSEEWARAREQLVRDLDLVGTYAPKPARDIPERYAERYFATMPIHEKLRRPDFPTLRNYMRVTLCNIHDDLAKRLDAGALTATWFERGITDTAGVG